MRKTKNKMIKKMKKRIQKISCMASRVWLAIYIISTSSLMNVYASSGAVTAPIENITELLADVISAIGVGIFIWGGFEMGNAMQTRDGSAKADALQRMAGGALMTVITQISSVVLG